MNWQNLFDRLVTESDQMRELDDRQFMELQAILPQRRALDPERMQRDPDWYERNQKAFEWMRSLLKFNVLAREQKATEANESRKVPPAIPTQPANREQAIQLGYVNVADIISALPDKFGDYATLNRYLDRLSHIRTYKPETNRKMIHAGDLIRQLAMQSDQGFDQLDRETIQERADSLRQQRKEGRK